MSRIQTLENLIDYHNNKYWVENAPEISDIEFDKLLIELYQLNPENSRFSQLHSPLINKQKVKLPIKMLSLDKQYELQGLLKWCKSVARSDNELFQVQPKYDGWASYYDGKILYTAGDGEYGDNITDKLPLLVFETAPNSSKFRRGEIIIKKSTFATNREQLKRKSGELYKTERSALTGVFSSDTTPNNLYNLFTFIQYGTHSILEPLLKRRDTWESYFNDITSYVKALDYPCDGLVIKLYDQEYSESLGETAHHPRGQIAFKFGNPSGWSKLVAVRWTLGKGNTLNPTALIEPVEIAGHTITKANLHNAKNIIDIKIQIGDLILVERCGEIIPDIVQVIPGENRTPITIDTCPACGSTIVYNEPILYCSNENCDGSLIKRLTDACSRLGMDNIGKGTVEKLVNIGIENIADIFEISLDRIKSLPGFAETSSLNLFNEIQRIKQSTIEDWRILSSLNIPGIGDSLSRTLLEHKTLEELRQGCSITDIFGFGESRAADLMIYLSYNSELLDRLNGILTIVRSNNNTDEPAKSVCFTGEMEKKRSYYEKLALDAGFIPVNSVTKSLTYLVCQDLNSNKGKVKKAKTLGIKMLHINDFLQLLKM